MKSIALSIHSKNKFTFSANSFEQTFALNQNPLKLGVNLLEDEHYEHGK